MTVVSSFSPEHMKGNFLSFTAVYLTESEHATATERVGWRDCSAGGLKNLHAAI